MQNNEKAIAKRERAEELKQLNDQLATILNDFQCDLISDEATKELTNQINNIKSGIKQRRTNETNSAKS